MHFSTKSYLKNNRNHTIKYSQSLFIFCFKSIILKKKFTSNYYFLIFLNKNILKIIITIILKELIVKRILLYNVLHSTLSYIYIYIYI